MSILLDPVFFVFGRSGDAVLNNGDYYLEVGLKAFFETLVSSDTVEHLVADFVPHVVLVKEESASNKSVRKPFGSKRLFRARLMVLIFIKKSFFELNLLWFFAHGHTSYK